MRKKIIKIYGERNTGTNYLEKLLKNNFEVKILRNVVPRIYKYNKFEFFIDLYFSLTGNHNLGWKHSVPNDKLIKKYFNLSNLLIITITKNPYSFLLSLYKKPYHGRKTDNLTQFLTREWKAVRRENVHEKVLKSPVLLWNYKNRAYLEIHKKLSIPVINLRYEDLIENPKREINKVSEICGLELKSKEFNNILSSTKNSYDTFNTYREYYLNENWKSKLTIKDIAIINNDLDLTLMKNFNYTLL